LHKKYFFNAGVNVISAYLHIILYYLNGLQVYNEDELVAALKKYENNAYKYLYMNYRGSLYNAILQIIPEQETASDVLQEVFVTVWQNIGKYDPGKGRLFTWLLKLTRNAAINKTRSKIYKSQMKNADIDNYVNYVEEKEPQEQDVNRIGLRKQVHLLREDYKNVVELSYYNGFTQEEIARALNIPLGTVKTRLRNALVELRKQFV
jgi:RNA polymerase sigma factor (sigma-70 family)